jgi:hypothetical protein
MRNARRFKIKPEGWSISRQDYETLVDIAREDMRKTLDVLAIKSLVQHRKSWERRWESVWQSNLDSCDDSGMCNMVLS